MIMTRTHTRHKINNIAWNTQCNRINHVQVQCTYNVVVIVSNIPKQKVEHEGNVDSSQSSSAGGQSGAAGRRSGEGSGRGRGFRIELLQE